MKDMKYLLLLSCVNFALAGCNSSTPVQNDMHQPITTQQSEAGKIDQDQNTHSEAIVVFGKGTSLQSAEETIASMGMQVLKVYRAISESTQKPMLHIGSPLPMEETLQKLRSDPNISSVSPNYKRHLY
ncbi:MAG: hypothetical protein P794_07895 [Epsilonproteobacteria bacterium (ex Lamellibrachia satsuma)]|nr:MAG: hypothetical protein P794_07895 [Epsilonproteobacteria bacterium (ex Lamellibrachia satsuma)]